MVRCPVGFFGVGDGVREGAGDLAAREVGREVDVRGGRGGYWWRGGAGETERVWAVGGVDVFEGGAAEGEGVGVGGGFGSGGVRHGIELCR